MGIDDPLEQAFRTLASQWDDPARHKAFVALAESLDRLADAAGMYNRFAGDPSRIAGVEEGRRRILAVAMARLETAPRASETEARKRRAWLVPLALLGLLVSVTFMLSVITGRRSIASPLVLALEMLVVAVLPWRRLRL